MDTAPGSSKNQYLLLGATGACGKALLPLLLADSKLEQVFAAGRRPPDMTHGKLQTISCELADIPKLRIPGQVSQVFCCLGTTIKDAGSNQAFRAVDVDAVITAGEWAKAQQVKAFHVVSAYGADTQSAIAYNQAKGDMENGLKALGLPSLLIYQPSLLLAQREKYRPGEAWAGRAAGLISWLPLNAVRKIRPLKVESLAEAMWRQSQQIEPGLKVISSLMMQH